MKELSDEEEESEEEEEEDTEHIPSTEMTEEEKLQEKLRNLRLGNTEPYDESESEEEEDDDEEEEEEEGEGLDEEARLKERSEKIERLNNRDYKAYRDNSIKKSSAAEKKLSAAEKKELEIKNKVARSLKGQGNGNNRGSRGNIQKGRGKKKNKNDLKGGDIF